MVRPTEALGSPKTKVGRSGASLSNPNRVLDSALAGREGQHGSGGRRDRPIIYVGVGASVPTARVPAAGMEANDTLVQAPDPNLLCPICINVLDNPLRTPCG